MAESPYDLVRVDTGAAQITVSRLIAERDDLEVLDKPAVDQLGHALPALPRTHKDGQPLSAADAAARGQAPETAAAEEAATDTNATTTSRRKTTK